MPSVKTILDCESVETATLSLSNLFGCAPDHLRSFVKDPGPLQYFELNWERLTVFDKWYYEMAVKRFGAPLMPSEICWFHGTRVPEGTTFSDGLLPLGDQIPRLVDMLVGLLDNDLEKEAVKSAFQRKGGNSFHFGNKLRNSMHWGPYAFLVKDVAISGNSLGQHDYLAMPEIIEDLCEEVRNADGLDLLPQYKAKLQPAIVKFKASVERSPEFALATALCYLNSVFIEGSASSNSVWCFDGKGCRVPAADILKVEWVGVA